MNLSSSTTATAFLLCGLAFACASQQKPNDAKVTVSNAQQAPQVKAKRMSDPAVTSSEPEPVAEPEAAPPPSPAPTVHPIEVLTGRDTAFVIDYANSGAQELSQKLCTTPLVDAKEDDAGKHQQQVDDCRAKERSKFTADILRFRINESGNGGKMTIYRRTGASLPEVYVARVAYEEIDKSHVKVKVKGGLSGARPICRDHQDLDITIPNGYSIELTDSVYGRLPYDAKVGLVAN